jgi:hypothetical protein
LDAGAIEFRDEEVRLVHHVETHAWIRTLDARGEKCAGSKAHGGIADDGATEAGPVSVLQAARECKGKTAGNVGIGQIEHVINHHTEFHREGREWMTAAMCVLPEGGVPAECCIQR